MALPDEPCQIEPRPSWTGQEKWVWKQICEGKIADLNKTSDFGGECDPNTPQGWSETRVLRPVFLETILLREPYRSGVPHQGVRIVGARFTHEIDLSSATLIRDLALNRCRFEAVVNLTLLRTRNGIVISLEGSYFAGSINMDAVQLDSHLLMRNAGFTEVSILGSKIGGHLSMAGSRFTGTLGMARIEVGGDLMMMEAEFAGVLLGSAEIRGHLFVSDSCFTRKLNMNGLEVRGSLNMGKRNRETRFAEVVLTGARVGDELSMSGSHFAATLNMESVQVAHHLRMDARAVFQEVFLANAKIGGDLDMSGSRFSGKLDMNGLQVRNNLRMREGADFAEVVLANAQIGGLLEMSNSLFVGTLNMNRLEVGSALLMREGVFAEVLLGSAKIEGQLDMIASRVGGKLNMKGLQVGNDLLMRDGAEFAEVLLGSAKIEGQLDMSGGSQFKCTLNMNGVKVGSALLMHGGSVFAGVNLVGAKIGDQFNMTGSRFTGELIMDGVQIGQACLMRGVEVTSCNLTASEIHNNFDISGSSLSFLDLTGTKIRGVFCLGSSQVPSVRWRTGAMLRLRNTAVETFEDRDAWPETLELDGFTYTFLASNVASRDVCWFTDWLAKSEYSSQAYEQLAGVLRNLGYKDKANRILFEGRQQERKNAKGWYKLWLLLLKLFIGYGYRNYYAAGWLLFFTLLGSIWLRASNQGPIHGMPYGISYSLDMLLPIVELRKIHHDIDLAGCVRYYFYIHKLIGWVLASFVIAGLSGLTRK